MSRLRKCVVAYLAVALIAFGVALLGTIRTGHHAMHDLWPVHSHYLLPIMLALWGYVLLGLAVVLIITWLAFGDSTETRT